MVLKVTVIKTMGYVMMMMKNDDNEGDGEGKGKEKKKNLRARQARPSGGLQEG